MKVKLLENGYIKTYENEKSINIVGSHDNDKEVLEWLTIDGNTIDPEFTALELEAQAIQAQINEAQAYLNATDFKMTTDYDQDTTAVKVLRAEARETIRTLSI